MLYQWVADYVFGSKVGKADAFDAIEYFHGVAQARGSAAG